MYNIIETAFNIVLQFNNVAINNPININRRITMRGIYMKITKGKDYYHKDMMDASYEERVSWYNSLSKGQIISILEKFVTNKTRGVFTYSSEKVE